MSRVERTEWRLKLEKLLCGIIGASEVEDPKELYEELNGYASDDERLAYLAQFDLIPLINLLIKKGEISTKAFDEALRAAAAAGQIKVIDRLLAEKVTDRGLNFALSMAANQGSEEVVLRLIDAGADVNNDNGTPLLFAVAANNIDIVRLLLDKGANVNADDDVSLQTAAQDGRIEIAKLLLERGANIHAADDAPLKYALSYGHYNLALFFLEKGATWDEIFEEEIPADRWAEFDAILKRSSLKRSPKKSSSQVSPKVSPRGAAKTSSPKVSPRGAAKTSADKTSVKVSADKRPQCAAITKAGTQCSFKAKEGSRYCGKHQQ